MLRYVIILFCCRLCFSYEYHTDLETDKDANEDRNQPRQIENIEKTVPFDVASFIGNFLGHSADSYDSNDYAPFSFTNSKRANRYMTGDDSNDPIRTDENTDFSILNVLNTENPTSKDTKSDSNAYEEFINNDRHSNRQNIIQKLHSRNPIEDPEKKCLFKNMKIPFFSHKSGITKKRKDCLFCFNCLKPYIENAKINTKIKFISDKIKKTYGNVCPACIQNLITRWNSKKKKMIQVHSTRGFYKQTGTYSKLQESNDDFYFMNDRTKRENKDRERQLHELAEVERKVNLVTAPNFRFTAKIPTRNNIN